MIDKSAVRIFALDDEPFMLKLIARMLENQGFTSVSCFETARAALESYDKPSTPPDVILLDLNMPDIDGVEFVRKLVERRYAGSLVLMSGEDERVLQTAEKLVHAHKITLLGRLDKPVSPQKMAALFDKWAPLQQRGLQAAKKPYAAEEVRAAIGKGELVNYYQPKVAVATGEVVGVETLVRWRHPVAGMVFPDQFVGVAEAHGLIDDLTRAVLTGALTQANAWRQMGLDLRVAVNVSMDNLTSLGFPDLVAGLAVNAGVPPRALMLEVTESRLMQDTRAALDILTRLRLKRFGLSIDDFGTGHSSLSQLRDIPFDELKIDRGFVHGAEANKTVRAIYDASLSLAKQLGMEVVAEGVEDRADWDFLCRTGCHLAQGYFIAKPMPAADPPSWMKVWRERVRSGFAAWA
ncbi:MAG: EAL domain-containing response regulator [Burkholderiales bacterium]